METADSLKRIFNCKDDRDLADLFGKADKSVVSHWRKNGLPAAIKQRAQELMQERGIETQADRELLSKQPPEVQMLVAEMAGLTDIDVLQMIIDVRRMKAARQQG